MRYRPAVVLVPVRRGGVVDVPDYVPSGLEGLPVSGCDFLVLQLFDRMSAPSFRGPVFQRERCFPEVRKLQEVVSSYV